MKNGLVKHFVSVICELVDPLPERATRLTNWPVSVLCGWDSIYSILRYSGTVVTVKWSKVLIGFIIVDDEW